MAPVCKLNGCPSLGKASAHFRKGREGDREAGDGERRCRRKGRKEKARRAVTLGGSDSMT